MGLVQFDQLDVWRESHTLTLSIYAATGAYPTIEKYGLVTQMRRAAISVPANIAEGFRRFGIKEKIRFYNISQSSLEELRYYLILSRDLGYPLDYSLLEGKVDQISRMLSGAISAVRRREG